MVLESSLQRQLGALNAKSQLSADRRLAEGQAIITDCQRRLAILKRQVQQITEELIGTLAEQHVDRLAAGELEGTRVPTITEGVDRACDHSVSLGDCVVIGACPGHGKTMALMQSLERASEAGHVCVLFSLEMGDVAIGERLAQMLVPELSRYGRCAADMAEAKRIVTDWKRKHTIIFRRCQPDYGVICAEMERCQREYGAVVFGIDYLGLLQGQGNGRYEVQTNAICAIQATCASLGVTAFVACQLSRPSDKTKAFKPKVSNLRDSGAF